MARRRSEEVEEVYNNSLEALAAGTEFKIGSQVNVLTTRGKVQTPVEVLNCLLGGGVPFGTVLQAYGPPKSSKSTWLYQMMGMFQHEYPNGIAVVVDTEASGDTERLEFLGVDTNRLLRLPATSIETGFLSLLKMLENKTKNEALKDTPVFVIWDSISKGLAQENSTQSRMNAQDRARIIKNYMSPMMAEIEKHDFILCLINQAIYTTDRYGNRKLDSGGGVALKHDVHFSAKLELSSDYKEGSFLITRTSNMSIDKSKISPEIQDIPVVLDIREGGKIDEVLSMYEYYLRQGWISQKSGWYSFEDSLEINKGNPFYPILASYTKRKRYNELLETIRTTPELYLVMKYSFMLYLSNLYKLQARVMENYMKQVEKELCTHITPYQIKYDTDDISVLEELFNSWRTNPELEYAFAISDVSKGDFISLEDATISDRMDLNPNTGNPSYVTCELFEKIHNKYAEWCVEKGYHNNANQVEETNNTEEVVPNEQGDISSI